MNLRQAVQDGGEGLRNVLEEAEELREGLSADFDTIAGDAAWLADAEKYLDTIEQNLETLWKAFADSAEVTQLIAEIELIIIELRNAEPSEWVELLQELEAKIEQLRILLGDIASAAPALKALAEALNGLLSVSISGLRQAAEDCCKLIKNAEQKLDELTKTASEYLELVKADGNRLENSVQKCVKSMRILRENIRNVLNGNGGNIEDISENAERDAENRAGGMAAKCRNFGDVSGDQFLQLIADRTNFCLNCFCLILFALSHECADLLADGFPLAAQFVALHLCLTEFLIQICYFIDQRQLVVLKLFANVFLYFFRVIPDPFDIDHGCFSFLFSGSILPFYICFT